MTLENAPIIVTIVGVVFLVAIIVTDAIFATNDIPNSLDTYGGRIQYYSLWIAAIPLACGIVSGHLFFPKIGGPLFGDWAISIPLMVAVVVMVTGGHLVWYRIADGPPAWFAIVYHLAGIPIGHYFWPQQPPGM